MIREDPDRLISVCSACRRASCWHGDFMCDEAWSAAIVEVPRCVLVGEGREDPHHFSDTRLREVEGVPA